MAGFNIDIEFDQLPSIGIDEQQIQEWIEARLNDARNLFIQNVSRGGGTGRVYRRGRRRTHQASAPGEYPATDTGGLARMLGPPDVRGREGSLYFSPHGAPFPQYLAEGTNRMAPRKMLDDAIREVLEHRPRTDVLARTVKLR